MKKLLVLALITLSTLTHAESVSKCAGTLLAVETPAFGGEKYTVDANWLIEDDGENLTASEGHIKMTGPVVQNGVAHVVSEKKTEQMTVIELDERHVQIKGQTLHKTGKIVANISGILTCK